jgi:hypothetical protein
VRDGWTGVGGQADEAATKRLLNRAVPRPADHPSGRLMAIDGGGVICVGGACRSRHERVRPGPLRDVRRWASGLQELGEGFYGFEGLGLGHAGGLEAEDDAVGA